MSIRRKQPFHKEDLLSFFHSLDVRPLSTLLGILPPNEPFCDRYSYRLPVFNVDALLMEVGKYSSDWPGQISGHRDEFLSGCFEPGPKLKPLMEAFLSFQDEDYLQKLYSTQNFLESGFDMNSLDVTKLADSYADFHFCYLGDNSFPRISFRYIGQDRKECLAIKDSKVLLDLVYPLWDTKPETFWDSMKDRPIGHSNDVFVSVMENGSVVISDRYFLRDMRFADDVLHLKSRGLPFGSVSFEDVSCGSLDYGGVFTYFVKPLYDCLLVREAEKLKDLGISRTYPSYIEEKNRMEPVAKLLSDCGVDAPQFNFEKKGLNEVINRAPNETATVKTKSEKEAHKKSRRERLIEKDKEKFKKVLDGSTSKNKKQKNIAPKK